MDWVTPIFAEALPASLVTVSALSVAAAPLFTSSHQGWKRLCPLPVCVSNELFCSRLAGAGVAVGLGDGDGLGDGLGDGVGDGLGDGLGVGEGDGVGDGLGDGEGVGLGLGLGDGVGLGEGVGLGDGVGLGVGDGLGVEDGEGVAVGAVLSGSEETYSVLATACAKALVALVEDSMRQS